MVQVAETSPLAKQRLTATLKVAWTADTPTTTVYTKRLGRKCWLRLIASRPRCRPMAIAGSQGRGNAICPPIAAVPVEAGYKWRWPSRHTFRDVVIELLSQRSLVSVSRKICRVFSRHWSFREVSSAPLTLLFHKSWEITGRQHSKWVVLSILPARSLKTRTACIGKRPTLRRTHA